MAPKAKPPTNNSMRTVGGAKAPPGGIYGPLNATAPSAASTSASAALAGQKRPASSASSPSSTPGTPGTPSKKGKKRPYRRTKRPVGYNDRSTVTTVTPKAATEAASINEYDLVMAEAED